VAGYGVLSCVKGGVIRKTFNGSL